MKPRLALIACLSLLAGCDALLVQPKPSDKTVTPVVSASSGTLCASTAKRLEAGRWDYSQRLYKSVKNVASDEGITLPADFETFMKPYIDKDLVITADMRSKLVSQFKLWGAK